MNESSTMEDTGQRSNKNPQKKKKKKKYQLKTKEENWNVECVEEGNKYINKM